MKNAIKTLGALALCLALVSPAMAWDWTNDADMLRAIDQKSWAERRADRARGGSDGYAATVFTDTRAKVLAQQNGEISQTLSLLGLDAQPTLSYATYVRGFEGFVAGATGEDARRFYYLVARELADKGFFSNHKGDTLGTLALMVNGTDNHDRVFNDKMLLWVLLEVGQGRVSGTAKAFSQALFEGNGEKGREILRREIPVDSYPKKYLPVFGSLPPFTYVALIWKYDIKRVVRAEEDLGNRPALLERQFGERVPAGVSWAVYVRTLNRLLEEVSDDECRRLFLLLAEGHTPYRGVPGAPLAAEIIASDWVHDLLTARWLQEERRGNELPAALDALRFSSYAFHYPPAGQVAKMVDALFGGDVAGAKAVLASVDGALLTKAMAKANSTLEE